MADALCGPSNPLQSFQKHSQVDRTLQQDRLAGPRHSPAQGFRTPDPRSGSLDAEFAAFEAGPANPFQFEQALPSHGGFPAFTGQPGPSNWANDFQKLQIHQPLPSQQFRTEAPLVRSSGGGWHNEFMRQRQGTPNSMVQEKQAIRQTPVNGYDWSTQGSYMPMFQPQQDMYADQMMHEPQHETDYSQVDFEGAFANAFQDAEMMNSDQLQAQGQELHNGMLHDDGSYTNDHSEDTINYDRPQDTARIGSDAIKYTEVQDRTADQDTRDADSLARTAGQLLNAVQHDTSTKFQESQFMALMRKIRDREVEVRDEDFKSTTPVSGAPPESAPSTLRDHWQPPDSTLRPHDPNTFQFPDMNEVYEPPVSESANEPVGVANQEYSFDDDQFGNSNGNTAFQPQSQIQALHPGGRWYPEQSPEPVSRHPAPPQMSGGISAEEFDRLDESGNLATRYQRPTVVDATPDGM